MNMNLWIMQLIMIIITPMDFVFTAKKIRNPRKQNWAAKKRRIDISNCSILKKYFDDKKDDYTLTKELIGNLKHSIYL